MSSDVELFFQSPANLYWSASPDNPLRQAYRELDAPLTRTLIGTTRNLFHLPGIRQDWDWSLSWAENLDRGALPSADLLLTSRFSVAIFFPASLMFLYLIGKKISGPIMGWMTAILFLGNPQIMLHTRRAMAESLLVFFFILFVFMIMQIKTHTWLLALPAALAFNAKQSALSLAVVAVIFILFYERKRSTKRLILSLGMFILLFSAVTLLLNPFLWSHPLNALASAVVHRQQLVTAQTETFALYNTGIVLDNYPKKALSLFAQVFFGPPQFAETGNYLDTLAPEILKYKTDWASKFFNHQVFHIIVLVFCVLGFASSINHIRKRSKDSRSLSLILITFLITLLSLFFLIPLSFQRYYLPLIPFLCILSAYVINEIWAQIIAFVQLKVTS